VALELEISVSSRNGSLPGPTEIGWISKDHASGVQPGFHARER